MSAAISGGLSTAQAQALLGSLRPVSNNLVTSGYALDGVASAYKMLGEQRSTSTADTTAVYGYLARTPTPNSGPDIYVGTAPRWIHPCELRTALDGPIAAGGAT